MSKTKFLGIPEGGKRAGWIEMEGGSAGVGGGNTVIYSVTMSNAADWNCNLPFEKVKELILSSSLGNVMLRMIEDDSIGYGVLKLGFMYNYEEDCVRFVTDETNGFLVTHNKDGISAEHFS